MTKGIKDLYNPYLPIEVFKGNKYSVINKFFTYFFTYEMENIMNCMKMEVNFNGIFKYGFYEKSRVIEKAAREINEIFGRKNIVSKSIKGKMELYNLSEDDAIFLTCLCYYRNFIREHNLKIYEILENEKYREEIGVILNNRDRECVNSYLDSIVKILKEKVETEVDKK